jgi:hypothetical protein
MNWTEGILLACVLGILGGLLVAKLMGIPMLPLPKVPGDDSTRDRYWRERLNAPESNVLNYTIQTSSSSSWVVTGQREDLTSALTILNPDNNVTVAYKP